jgi:hypothetical protein
VNCLAGHRASAAAIPLITDMKTDGRHIRFGPYAFAERPFEIARHRRRFDRSICCGGALARDSQDRILGTDIPKADSPCSIGIYSSATVSLFVKKSSLQSTLKFPVKRYG